MNTKSFLVTLLSILFSAAYSQQNNNAFSLQQAIDYSIKNSPNYLNAELDKKSAIYKKNEIAGLGLPQITGSFDFKDYFDIPVSIVDASAFDRTLPPEIYYQTLKFGLKYNASAGFSASQLLFSADYIFGLKAAKEYIALSTISAQRTKSELISQVSKAYYGVLINKERLKLIDANITKLDKSLSDLKAFNKQGLVELIDVERLEVASNNLATEKEKVIQLISVGENLLKFQIGYKINEAIVLTDSLNLTDDLKQEVTVNVADFSKREDYQLLKAQNVLSDIDVKRLKWGYLPTLAAYGSYQFNTIRPNANIFESDKNNAVKQWYPISLIGVTANLNIFDGLQRHYKIQQAKITLQKSENGLKNIELAAQLESSIAAITFNNAIKTLKNNERNMTLAKHVYEVAQKKFDQGVGSNLEIVNAQASVREAEINYFNSIYDLLIAKIDYQKATGTLVK
ncbi:MAG: TolC family protein [Bacteroidota bacterium]|nr:TolC family protein [Bacteroidota bacterium]